jgi:hypothetical protein
MTAPSSAPRRTQMLAGSQRPADSRLQTTNSTRLRCERGGRPAALDEAEQRAAAGRARVNPPIAEGRASDVSAPPPGSAYASFGNARGPSVAGKIAKAESKAIELSPTDSCSLPGCCDDGHRHVWSRRADARRIQDERIHSIGQAPWSGWWAGAHMQALAREVTWNRLAAVRG